VRLPFLSSYRTLNVVNLFEAALRHNLNSYRELMPDKAICPVLKSNAYGHGLVEVARVLDEAVPEFLVVDSLYEAYELKKVGIKSKVLILGYTFEENLKGRRLPFHFACTSVEMAKVLIEMGASLHLKIDTGMNRMGFNVDELQEVLPLLRKMGANVVGVMTHLAEADMEAGDEFTRQQADLFEEAVKQVRDAGFDPQWIHAGQTAGSLKLNDDRFNMVRLGLGLYGISLSEELNLRPVMEVRSTVVEVRDLLLGDKVSYGGTFVADRKMKIAVVPFGYYEGLPWNLSSTGCFNVGGVICPIVGRVCMNYTMVDVSMVPGVAVGDPVVVYSAERGEANSIQEMARLAKTIPYELMVRVAESVRREVV